MTIASIQLLGTGGSMGVPMVACSCSVCTSHNPHNRRLRCSALIQWDDRALLIDVGPDFRQQMLTYRVQSLDGVIITHSHYDHIGGIDELRAHYFRHRRSIPCLLGEETLADLHRRYEYMFRTNEDGEYYTPHLDFQLVEGETGGRSFLEMPVRYFTYMQAGMPVLGLRFGSLAYVTDLYRPEADIFSHLDGVETLIVSALRFTESPVHMSVDEAIDFARKVGASQTYFTHIAHELDHDKANSYLPKGISMGYDGLTLTFPWL